MVDVMAFPVMVVKMKQADGTRWVAFTPQYRFSITGHGETAAEATKNFQIQLGEFLDDIDIPGFNSPPTFEGMEWLFYDMHLTAEQEAVLKVYPHRYDPETGVCMYGCGKQRKVLTFRAESAITEARDNPAYSETCWCRCPKHPGLTNPQD